MKFPIPDEALQQHVIALGKTRSGKSSKLRLIVERFLDRKKPVCIIDPKGDWWGLKSSGDGKNAGYPIIIFGSEHARHADIRINQHSGAAIAELIATGNRPALIDMRGMSPSYRNKFFIDFAKTYFTHATGERVLAIDEVHNFAPQGKVRDIEAGDTLHWANRLITEGAGMGITMLSASQRPQKVHKDFVTSHETLIACRVIHKLDRDAIRDWIDACGDPDVGKDVLATLASMKREEAWVYSPEADFGPERITFPMFQTYDSFKPQAIQAKRLKGWADVDMGEVQARLAKVVEEAKANDPRELKAEIAKLRADLAKKPIVTADPEKIAAAEARGFKRGFEEATKEATIHFNSLRELARSTVAGFASSFDSNIRAERLAIIKHETIPPPTPIASSPPRPAPAVISRPSSGENGTVSPTVRKIIDAIHRANPMALSFDAAASRAAVSKRSSAYGSYRKQVAASPEVNQRSDGRYESAPSYAEPPGPGIDPVEEFASRLPPSYGTMLRVIAREGSVTKEQVASMANVSPTSSGLSAGISELTKLSLIQKDGEFYRLHEDLK
jgi:uncharacterized protein